MKRCFSSSLLTLVVAASATAVLGIESKDRVATSALKEDLKSPQPRMRLVQAGAVASAQKETDLDKAFQQEALSLQPVDVSAPAVFTLQRPMESMPQRRFEPEPPALPFSKGGPVIKKRNLGRYQVSVGITPYSDLFSDDAQFGTTGPRPAYELVRITR